MQRLGGGKEVRGTEQRLLWLQLVGRWGGGGRGAGTSQTSNLGAMEKRPFAFILLGPVNP